MTSPQVSLLSEPSKFVESIRLKGHQDIRDIKNNIFSLCLDAVSDEKLDQLIEALGNDAYDYHLEEWYTEYVYEILHRFNVEKHGRESLDKYIDVIEMNSQELDRRELLADLPKLMRKYGFWVRDDLMLAALIDGAPKGYLAAKRGNKAYIKSLENRIEKFEAQLPAIQFFDTSNPHNRKPRRTNVISCTLTYKQKNISMYDAWNNVGGDVNRFVANVRKKYGDEVRIFRTYESHKSGYPHVNIILVFKDTGFSVFYQPYKKTDKNQKREGAWRIVNKSAISSCWEEFPGKPNIGMRGHCDVVAVSSIEGVMDSPEDSDPNSFPLMHAVKYMLKDYRDVSYDEYHKKGYLQTSIIWLMRKRAFSFSTSRDGRNLFIEAVAGVAGRLDWTIKTNSNPDFDKDMENSDRFEFLGVFHYFQIELKTKWTPPPDLSYILPAEVLQFLSGCSVIKDGVVHSSAHNIELLSKADHDKAIVDIEEWELSYLQNTLCEAEPETNQFSLSTEGVKP